MSVPKGMVVLRPYGSVEIDDSPEMKELVKAHNLVGDMKSLEKNISDHKGYVDKMMAKLGIRKQEPEPEPKPKPKDQKDTVDQKSILEVIKSIAETLSDHAEIIQDLSDRVETLEQGQTRKTDGRSTITHSQPSQLDLEILESKFEQIGLCGEIRKIITPFEVIND